ncbi:MAG: hypothetical protein JEZ08_00565 [Clostridiales bacterium]|nr:hypothetical protein [Clostridiales bacterium]
MNLYKWCGIDNKYLDVIEVKKGDDVTFGCYGGATASGQYTNEDGYFVIAKDKEFVCAVLLDAHATDESVGLVLDSLSKNEKEISNRANLSLKDSMRKIPEFFMALIHDSEFIERSKSITGETAFLVVFQKENYLWWLSVGDNSLYLFHPEFAELGQYRLNERIFYQWIGQKNSIDLEIPCFVQGTIEFRKGKHTILMLTDGVLEVGDRPFEDSKKLFDLYQGDHETATKDVLGVVKNAQGRDSCTIISWDVVNEKEGLRPTVINKR